MRVDRRNTINKRRPNRPAVAEAKGSLDLTVGSIKYDMAMNPFLGQSTHVQIIM